MSAKYRDRIIAEYGGSTLRELLDGYAHAIDLCIFNHKRWQEAMETLPGDATMDQLAEVIQRNEEQRKTGIHTYHAILLLGPRVAAALESYGIDSTAVCEMTAAVQNIGEVKTHLVEAYAIPAKTLAERLKARIAASATIAMPGANPPTAATARPGRRRDPRIQERNKRLRELCKENELAGQWTELARIANKDPGILGLALDREVDSEDARNAVKPRRKTRGTN